MNEINLGYNIYISQDSIRNLDAFVKELRDDPCIKKELRYLKKYIQDAANKTKVNSANIIISEL